MSSEEPPSKKLKSEEKEWEDHRMNIANAVMKEDEGIHLCEIANSADLKVLQGIGPKHDDVLEHLGLKTIKDLATYKYFLVARSIKTLSAIEGKRPEGSIMNIDHALDKDYETKSLKELLEAPLSALEGITDKAGALLKELGVKTIGDLAEFKYASWAEAIVELAKHEESKTKEERHLDRELKKLA